METEDEAQPAPNQWQNASFVQVSTGQVTKRQFYTGEGEDDIMDYWGIIDILHDQDVAEEGKLRTVVEILWEEYKQSWTKW